MPALQVPNTHSRQASKARHALARVRSHVARSDRFRAWTIAFALFVAAAGAQATWRGAGFPLPRDGHALVFDQARGRTVLFGGPAIDSYELADTWVWDGTRWLHRAHAPPTPGPRAYHAMVYDTVRNRVVPHGGAIGGLGTTEGTTIGAGQANGSILSCVTEPFLGEYLDLRLTTGSAFNVLLISAGTCVVPPPTVGAPFCSSTSVFPSLTALTSATMSGQPARIILPIPKDVGIWFAPLCFQGVSLEAPVCLRASNGLQVRLQQRDR